MSEFQLEVWTPECRSGSDRVFLGADCCGCWHVCVLWLCGMCVALCLMWVRGQSVKQDGVPVPVPGWERSVQIMCVFLYQVWPRASVSMTLGCVSPWCCTRGCLARWESAFFCTPRQGCPVDVGSRACVRMCVICGMQCPVPEPRLCLHFWCQHLGLSVCPPVCLCPAGPVTPPPPAPGRWAGCGQPAQVAPLYVCSVG